MRLRLLLAIAGSIAFSILPLRASILTISGTSDTVVAHNYVDPSVGYQSDETLALHFDVSAQPHLKNYTEFILTATAPAGEAWLFNTAAAISNPNLEIYAATDYATGTVLNPISRSVSFTFAPGSSTNLTGNSLSAYLLNGASNSGAGFNLLVYRGLTTSVAITSFTVDIVYNNSTLEDDPITGLNTATLYFDYDAASDPGTLLTLVAAPEPGSAALLLAGAGYCGTLRLRRGKRLAAGAI